MEITIQQAAKGSGAAMLQLVNANGAAIYCLARGLLKNTEQAVPAASWALQSALLAVKNGSVRTEAEFTRHAARQTAAFCKKEVTKKDPRAFRLPPNKDFRIAHINARMLLPEASLAENCARCLPALQRFAFALRYLSDLSADTLAELLSIDTDTVRLIEAAETENLALICSAIDASGKIDDPAAAFAETVKNTPIPAEMNAAMQAYVNTLATPPKKPVKPAIAILAAAVVVCVIVLAAVFGGKNIFTNTTAGNNTGNSGSAGSTATDPAYSLDPDVIYYADMVIKDYGTITVKLEPKSAPVTVANFVELAESGFYNGLTFHRIIEDFMMQGGDPKGNGTGGSGKNIVGEFSENGHGNKLSHTRGALSMARATPYNSASSQFFIVHKDNQESLDGKYAVFGYVTAGMDVVDTICTTAEPTDSNGSIAKADQPVITSITVRKEPVNQ